jgi:EpsI family protein
MTAERAKPGTRASWLLAASILATAVAAQAWRSELASPVASPGPELGAMIPTQFGDWRSVSRGRVPVIDPKLVARVEAVYADTLERVYRRPDGRQVMLSIAYGTRQLADRDQAHRPEYCYTAQGFTIDDAEDTRLETASGSLPVRRLVSRRGTRHEAVTYWLTVGRRAVLPGITRQLQQLRYGLSGEVPDGLLVRVSSLDRDSARAHHLQAAFIGALLQALAPADRERLAGLRSIDDAARSSSL